MDTKAQKLADVVVNYLRSMDQMELLPDVVAALKKPAARYDQSLVVTVTSATKLDKAELATVAAYVTRRVGERREVVNVVDPSLLAGFTLKIGDEVLDTSLSSKLEHMKVQLTK